MQINEYWHIRVWWAIAIDLLPPITPTWYCSRLTPSIHPYAVSPDLVNLWLDSMFISPLELSWEICWCTTATQSVAELSRKVQVMQTLEDVLIRSYSTSGDCCSALSVYLFFNSIINANYMSTNLGGYWIQQYSLVKLPLLGMAVHSLKQR